jgi:hypothetical protein
MQRLGLDSSDSGQVAGCCQYGNEPLVSIKYGEIFNWVRNYQLLNKSSVPQNYLVSKLAKLGCA